MGTRAFRGRACNWHWKWGLSSGAESLICGAWTSSEQMVSGLTRLQDPQPELRSQSWTSVLRKDPSR